MANGKPWIFTQIGGTRSPLTLDGWQAPFGRPRHSTIVNAGLVIRHQVTYYPGGQVPPTVHSFGRMGKPWEIKGRWMDAAIGLKDGAKTFVAQWKDFVADEREVRAQWGDVFSYRIFIHDIDIEFESEAHVAWTLRAVVLVDEQATVAPVFTRLKQPFDIAKAMSVELGDALRIQKHDFGNILALLPEIGDAIDGLVSAILTPFAAVYDTASAISDFETALSTDLVKLGSGLTECRTGLLNLRDTTDFLVASVHASMDNVLPSGGGYGGLYSAGDVLQVSSAKASSDRATATFLLLVADMQANIDVATVGRVQSAHLAQSGDSFEDIAARTLGGPGAARALRNLNGVRSGSRPVPGKPYKLPARV